MKECVESIPNTFQYANLHLKNKKVDLAINFLERGGSFLKTSKHLCKIKRVGKGAVKIHPNNF